METPTVESLEAVRLAMLNPRLQMRAAVALQIGQLNELSRLLARFQTVVEEAGASWSALTDRGLAAQEDQNRGLQNLAEAQRRQEDALSAFRQGLTAAKDEDTARLEAGLRNLGMATQDLRSAIETVAGVGNRFQGQVQEALRDLERSVPEAAGLAASRLDQSSGTFREAMRPLVWIGGMLTVLLAADLVVRVFR